MKKWVEGAADSLGTDCDRYLEMMNLIGLSTYESDNFMES